MAIGIDDIDDFDEPIQEPQAEPESISSEEPIESPAEGTTEDDIIKSLLNDRGIKDPDKITFEDDGVVTERSWNDLTNDEKRAILNQSPDKDPEVDLDEQEIQMINQMRLNGMNPEQYVTALRKQGYDYYAKTQNDTTPDYSTDDLSDDELYMLDIQYRTPEMTEQEAYDALVAAKANETLFNKQMAGLRNYYRGLETDMKTQKDAEAKEQEQQQFQQYSNSIMDAIQNTKSIGNLDIDLDQQDKEDIAQFILGRDQAGINWFGKALEDPDTVVRMAWFALKGDEAFNDIENYISEQIKSAAQNAYNKGLADGKNKGNASVVITNPKPMMQRPQETISVNDLDF